MFLQCLAIPHIKSITTEGAELSGVVIIICKKSIKVSNPGIVTMLFTFYQEEIHIVFQFHFTLSNPQRRYEFSIMLDMIHINCHVVILLKLCKIIYFHWHGTSFKIVFDKKWFILCWIVRIILINFIIMLRCSNAVHCTVIIFILGIDDRTFS